MRAIRAATAALLGAASLVLTAPLAVADDGKQTSPLFTVSPSTVSPGGRVALSASGCTTTAYASSGVFDAVTIQPGHLRHRRGGLGRPARRPVLGPVQLPRQRPRNVQSHDRRRTLHPHHPVPTVTTSPQGVRGGLGGSAERMDPREIAAGGALVLAAATATVFVVRRRAGSRRH